MQIGETGNFSTLSTRRLQRPLVGVALVVSAFQLTGCASTPPPMTGFLGDYSKLVKDKDGALRHIDPELRGYSGFIVAPVQIRTQRTPPVLEPSERAEVARYMRDSLRKVLREAGFRLTETPDSEIGLIRVAITDVQKSKWYLNLHPGTKLTGAGLGGASMEGEVVDSVTGKQLGAVVQSGKGNRFELDTFSELDDVKDVIDRWAEAAGKRLKELRERPER
ncbi:MAG: DUF3313 domain-containing protein [Planctomycetota bacterium]|nr:DUF3313 domain-containing protein [Planctomycetota bacterium]